VLCVPFAIAQDELALREVKILDSQPQTLHQPQPTPFEQVRAFIPAVDEQNFDRLETQLATMA
jgi:hypothetical protein